MVTPVLRTKLECQTVIQMQAECSSCGHQASSWLARLRVVEDAKGKIPGGACGHYGIPAAMDAEPSSACTAGLERGQPPQEVVKQVEKEQCNCVPHHQFLYN